MSSSSDGGTRPVGRPFGTPIRVERLLQDIEALSRFGAIASGGTDRPCFSSVYRAAADWVAERMEEAGMAVRTDAAGNLIGRLGPTDAPAVICGSHIDSVPGGGRYDGALGVLAGVECARVISTDADLDRALEVVAFADEEGAFLSLLGSRAMVGDLEPAEITGSVGRDGAPLADVMRAYGLEPERITEAARSRAEIAAYLELHIEQGPVLESEEMDIGVVTDVVGAQVTEWQFTGEAAHAGTSKVGQRCDAFRAVAETITRAYEVFERDFDVDRHRLNFGVVEVQPGACNVIPGLVRVQQEIRATLDDAIDAISNVIREIAGETAAARNASIASRLISRDAPSAMSESILRRIEACCSEAGVRWMRMPSGAGHDAQIMARFCDAGMIFIPSHLGISHHHSEHSSTREVETGAAILYLMLRSLLSR